MPRIDDYITAKEIAVGQLSNQSFELILKRSGFASQAENALRVPFLDRIYGVRYPDFEFKDQTDADRDSASNAKDRGRSEDPKNEAVINVT